MPLNNLLEFLAFIVHILGVIALACNMSQLAKDRPNP